jgi:DNA/RNA endonuclease YhcR with UshA esterase domain
MRRLLSSVLCLLISTGFLQAQTIPASEASKHIGEQATVCGQIVSKHTAESVSGKPTFVDLDHAFPHQSFTLVIWENDKSKVGELPSTGTVCVTGKITEYKGTPQIVLHDSKDWSLSPKPAGQ